MLDSPRTKPFFRAIEQLLNTNKLILYGKVDGVSTTEMEAVLELLKERFERVATGYPGPTPRWDPEAAGWAALVLFHAAQLMLYRSHKADALVDYFPAFDHPKTAEAIISADSCLRYLPAILRHLEAIDVEDELIPILKNLLGEWHFSGLLADSPPEPTDLTTVVEDECLAGLYVDRIIETKNKTLARRPEFQGLVSSALGNHAKEYWKALKPAQ